MDKAKLKRIIAREGLILVGLIGVGIILDFSLSFTLKAFDYNIEQRIGHSLESVIWFPIFWGYLIYVFLIRFIIWAVKTLKK